VQPPALAAPLAVRPVADVFEEMHLMRRRQTQNESRSHLRLGGYSANGDVKLPYSERCTMLCLIQS
jgi:hypothetical protein